MVAMDTTERVHLLNVRDDTPIEVPHLHSVALLYELFPSDTGLESGRTSLWF